MKKIEKKLEKTDDIDLKLRCFFMIVISRYLLPAQGTTVNEKAVMYTRDLTLVSKIDWCTVIYEHLRESVDLWKIEKDKPVKPKKGGGLPEKPINGCCMIPMV